MNYFNYKSIEFKYKEIYFNMQIRAIYYLNYLKNIFSNILK